MAEAQGRLTILHTSDWHLGGLLYRKSRLDACRVFLEWLLETIREQRVNVLLVAGDVFDGIAPGSRVQELYYRFLGRASRESSLRHIVLTAGNHDSPAFLTAPAEILRSLHVHVTGTGSAPEQEVLLLRDAEGVPELVLCAVPFLRDRDVRLAQDGETPEDKERRLAEGIRAHYADVCGLAESVHSSCGRDIPVIAMGHLFVAGGRVVEGDGVRDLYVGSLGCVSTDIFPDSLDYVALGHLHAPQLVGGNPFRRYSGSPMPVGFGEAGHSKSVCLVRFCGRRPEVETLPVPVFQRLERIAGSEQGLARKLSELARDRESVWVEALCESDAPSGMRERLEEIVSGTQVELLCVKNTALRARMLACEGEEERLEELRVDEVFERCLNAGNVDEDRRQALRMTFAEALAALEDEPEEEGRALSCAF